MASDDAPMDVVDNAPETTSIRVTVDGDRTVIVETGGGTDVHTFGDLKRKLHDMGHRLTEYHYLSLHSKVDDRVERGVYDEEEIDVPEDMEIHLELTRFRIKITALGSTQELELPALVTVAEATRAYTDARLGPLEAVSNLSHNGMRLDPEERLFGGDRGIGDGDTVNGKMVVTVVDDKCDTEHVIHVDDFLRLEHLLKAYADVTNRLLTTENAIVTMTDEDEKDRTVAPDASLFDQTFHDGIKVNIEARPYKIYVVSRSLSDETAEEKETELEVEDHFTVRQVKAHLRSKTYEVLQDGDKLVYKGDQLNEEEMIYKYKIRDGDRLLLEREEVAFTHKYICAECGSEVALKKDDPVMCKTCGHRIVYKKRTTNVNMYMAR